jgi:branched-chain amino acid transport system substrate-binding protein
MNDRVTRRAVLKGAAALGLAAPAAGALLRQAPLAAAQAETIKIGNPYNLTGDYASIDNPAKDGSALAADEVNAAGGVLGKQIELIVYDGKSDLPTIASVTKKMVDEDKVVALVGLTDTSYMKAAGPVAQAAKIPFLDVGGTAPIITQIGDYIYMLPFGDNVQAAAGAEFAQEKGWKTVAMLVDEAMDYTKYLAKYFEERYTSEDIGGKVLSRLAYNIGDTDFSAQLTQFKNLDPQPDFFFVSSNPGEIGTIIKQARDLGLKQPILGGDGYDTPLLAQLAGPVNDVYFTTHQGIYGDTPQSKAFSEAYAKKYGHPPEAVFAALGYDGVKLMADAIKRAGTTEGDKVRDALGATKDFQGVTGKISYENGSHIPSKSVALIQVVNGKNTLLKIVVPKTVPPA